ncbi:hypothetical protein [Erwinia phyllosphaerae]|uniref:hypothetical protein n=1 Tax=Erwinia phyllosphaerae TaxID=2853256 RepID=UPI001FF04720|nr:hypothetical protein [Erwinia phyllosphaerae]MBV4365888.1 hypothetical protein [Erwinia phyllosphaerae]
MKKLTAEVARREISYLNVKQLSPSMGLTTEEGLYLESLEIALPILEQQERASNQQEKN